MSKLGAISWVLDNQGEVTGLRLSLRTEVDGKSRALSAELSLEDARMIASFVSRPPERPTLTPYSRSS
jgi:hypothetical protein